MRRVHWSSYIRGIEVWRSTDSDRRNRIGEGEREIIRLHSKIILVNYYPDGVLHKSFHNKSVDSVGWIITTDSVVCINPYKASYSVLAYLF